MNGFFTKKETDSVAASGGKIHSCASCGLYKYCQTPKMKPYGEFKKAIMVIGNYPKPVDDETGKPFSDRDGQFLQHELRRLGINLYEDCVSLNAVNCAPGGEGPKSTEIDHCRSVIVWKAIKQYQPKVILLFGQAAVTSVIGQQWSGTDNINTWQGLTIPDQSLKAWLCPLFAPDQILRIEKPAHYMKVWRDGLENALKLAEIPLPRHKQADIRYVEDSRFLKEINADLASFDYETTGIKPHAKGHRIVCVSIADREDRVWVFPAPKKKAGWQPFRRWLHDAKYRKMAHNLKFEHSWSKNILKVHVNGWEWDSMVAAHIIDNRPGIAGLKFQTYCQLGIPDYSEEVNQYLRSVGDEEGANSKNRVLKLMKSKQGRGKLMHYCALDSVYQYKIALKQMEVLDHPFLPF